jgi:hypothetical protein
MSEAEGEWADVLHKSQETTINLKKLSQMPASVFLNHSGRNWQNPDCSFYLPVSMSRITTVAKYRGIEVELFNANTHAQMQCRIDQLKFAR